MNADWLNEAFAGPAWHGPSLLGALRGVSDDLAVWRPAAGRHTIREIVLHCAYWKHTVRGRLTGSRERFARPGRNWIEAGAESWRGDVVLLKDEHRRLIALVRRLPDRGASRSAAARNIRGVAAHDIYHAGQIQLIRKLARSS
jgi:uncharacterized damage-inducible protein DinB